MTDLRALIRLLTDAEVDYILVGGVAAVAHGSARLTQDLDFVYSRSDANIEKLVAALSAHAPYLRGAAPRLPFRWDGETICQGLNFTLTTGKAVRCLDLEWLIRTKRAAGRPRDLARQRVKWPRGTATVTSLRSTRSPRWVEKAPAEVDG